MNYFRTTITFTPANTGDVRLSSAYAGVHMSFAESRSVSMIEFKKDDNGASSPGIAT